MLKEKSNACDCKKTPPPPAPKPTCHVCSEVESKIYLVPVKDLKNTTHILECYGVDVIARDAELPNKKTYEAVCRKFGVHSGQVRRPHRIDLYHHRLLFC